MRPVPGHLRRPVFPLVPEASGGSRLCWQFGKLKVKRVLFFDSGVGGLSIYKAAREANPGIEAYYLFDNEGFPYGEKKEDFLIARVDHILDSAQKRFLPDAVVVACNTASTVVLPSLRASISTPVIGVVPAIKPACLMSRKKIVALLATPGTVSRAYTLKLIDTWANGCKVLRLGSAELARIAEERLSGKEVDLEQVKKILKPLIDLEDSERPDIVVLGCTHYPFIRDVLMQLLPDMSFMDSGEAIGRRVADILSHVKEHAGREHTEDRAFYTGELKHYEDRLEMVRSLGFKSLEQFKL